MKTLLTVVVFLAAIIAANLSIAHYGPEAAVWNAFLFIGLDLTLRDKLHDMFEGHRVLGMGALILAGSLLSYALNHEAATIAVASCVAFAAAATVDAIVYQARRHVPWIERSNESNVAGAATDSLIFPALAFPGPLMWVIVLTQFCAKVAGGFLWSLLLNRRKDA